MAEIKGLGKCGICHEDLQDANGIPSPVRHFKDFQLAHKACMDAYSAEDAERDRLKEQIARSEGQIAAMQGDLDRAKARLAELS